MHPASKTASDQLSVDYEKMIQTLVEKNIETIFPELEFVFTEFPLDELRIDSVAFNKESNSFVILEYKNIKHGGVIDQGMAYLDLLEDKREAFVLLYNNEKEKSLKMDDVEWDESKVIIIAPEFTPHQLRSANRTKDPIELYQIGRFEDDVITLQKIQKSKESSNKTKSKIKQIVRLGEYSEEDYLAGKYYKSSSPPTEHSKRLFKILKDKIIKKYPDLEIKQKSKYVGFYSPKDGSAICTIVVVRNNIEFCFSIRKKDVFPNIDFITYMVKPNGDKRGHWGLGDYITKINSESDIDRVVPLIEKVIISK